ncbi:hypothetical protein [Pseudomonas frederiksbergensis]|uniref:hypothetical protein n=1 Tax=Pseudomonas frederiksbergensis TaxID=104087 RepID=UPI003D20F642
MNDLDVVKGFIVQLVQDRKGSFDDGGWEADYTLNWDSEFSERMEKGLFNIAKAISARKSEDDVMLKAALLHARVDFMGLANFFRDIYDDIDTLVRDKSWPEIPGDFDYEQ